MKKRILVSILAGIMGVCSCSFAIISERYIKKTLERDQWGCAATDVDIYRDEEGTYYLYKLFDACHEWRVDGECYRWADPEELYEFEGINAELEFIVPSENVVLSGEKYYEQGVTLKREEDYQLIGEATADENWINQNGAFDIVYYNGAWGSRENQRYKEYKIDFQKNLELNGVPIGNTDIIELDDGLEEYTLNYECEEILAYTETVKYRRDRDPWTTRNTNGRDTIGTYAVEESFYVGPYPTVYYNAILKDNNEESHEDKLTIKNIKLTCTYKPNGIWISLYNKDGVEKESFYIEAKEENISERGDEMGYNVKFDEVSSYLGYNINPMDDYYLMVVPDDGRGDYTNADITTPSRPKYAKFGNPGF